MNTWKIHPTNGNIVARDRYITPEEIIAEHEANEKLMGYARDLQTMLRGMLDGAGEGERLDIQKKIDALDNVLNR